MIDRFDHSKFAMCPLCKGKKRIRLNMDRNLGRVRVSTALLVQALGFPEGTEVVACFGERAGYPGDIDLVLEHPDLPPVGEAGEAPELSPTFEIVGPKPASYLKVDWGLNKKD